MLVITIGAALTCFELLNLLRQMNNKWFKTFLGYSWILEITASFVLPLMALVTGSITALLISIVGGFMFTVTLEVVKRLCGTRKYVRKQGWVETEGVSLAVFLKGLFRGSKERLSAFTEELASC